MRAALLLFSTGLMGCATATLVGQRPPLSTIEAGPPRTVVIEPLFERSELQISAPKPTDKALYLRPQVRAAVFERLVATVTKLRPQWRVAAPGALAAITGPVVLVRTVLDTSELAESDRTLKNAAFAFGLVLLPLQILAAFPVEETQRTTGTLSRLKLDAAVLKDRLVKYATQADFAVNVAGHTPAQQPFSFDVTYEEGLFADESPRTAVLVEGLVEKLAYAIVTFIEEEP